MLSLILPINNQKSLYLLFWYMFTNVVLSADGTRASLDKEIEYIHDIYTSIYTISTTLVVQSR